MDASKPATQIGKYEVLSELGRGGMGVVYRAEDKMIGREVAIKQLLDATPELRQRFLVEARSGVLNHQNIVTVYDFGEQDGNPYIVMEFLRGESLERLLKGGRPLPLVEKLEIIRQVAEGLGYAHQKGVVHRDIKPANIMVQPDGHIKIVDFGIARLESTSGHTQTGAVIGTFHYISPERLKGEPSDGRADLWATGVMMYLMLTGRLPFPGDDISALHKVVNEPYEPLSNFLTGYPPTLDGVIERALAKNPDDRYGSGEEMAAEVEAINEALKRSRVGEVLIQVKGMLDQEELNTARPMLMDLQRLDPGNTEVKRLLRVVQDKLSRQQKSDQIRQLVQQADRAVQEEKFSEALEVYKQANKLDPANTAVISKLNEVREIKEKADKVEALKNQAREARHRNDFAAAANAIGEAMALDRNNTDLRNEHARILQEQERLTKEGSRKRLKDAGRDSLSARQFTAAIQNLREALAIDPTDFETQQMYQDAVAKQEEDRRRKIIDQIVGEIQDQVFRGQLTQALELINRALERLPGEGVLLRLKAETQKKVNDASAQKLVDETSIAVQNLFFSDPQSALDVVQKALEQMPGEEKLLALQERVIGQLKKANLEGLRAQYLKQAQAAVDARDFSQAIQVLETASLDCGQSPEIQSLLEYAQSEKKTTEQRQINGAAIQKAQELIGAGSLEEAISTLRIAGQQTNDPAVLQLLRQTQERFEDVGRKVDAVIQRIQALSETDAPRALQLLQSQAQAIQQHPQMRALRAKLDTRSELERATREAVQRAGDQLQQGQLREGLETLEAVRQAYGATPQVDNAIADYKLRRAPIAQKMLTTAMSSARQAVLVQEASRALELLRKSSSAVEFGDAATQADWKRLANEVTKAAGVKRGSTDNLPIVVQGSKLSAKVIGLIASAAVIIIVGAIFLFRPKPQVPVSYLQLNASPFAEVLSITSDGGTSVKLPADEHATPLRMDVPEGMYTVTFRGPDGATKSQQCSVSASADAHTCSADIAPLTDADIETIIKGGGQ